MWGEQGRVGKRGSWRDVDPMPALPGESREHRLLRLREARHDAFREAREKGRVAGSEGVEGGLPPLVPVGRNGKEKS